MENKNLYQRVLIRTLILIIAVLFVVFLGKRIFDALFPIILSLIIIAILKPLIIKIDQVLPIKSKLVSYIVGTVLLLLIVFLTIWIIQLIVTQLAGLIGNIIKNWSEIVHSVNAMIFKANSKINLMPQYISNAIRSALNSVYNFLGDLQKNAVNMTLGFTTAFINTSNDIIFFIITFVVSFYIMLGDMDDMDAFYERNIPEKSRKNLHLINEVFKKSTWNYIKAQIKMAILCGIIMSIVLRVLGQEYFIPIALILAFVDLLPMIGAVIVLLPWSIIEILVFENVFKGMALIILLSFWTGLRQVIAPKIIGSSADIHPILSVIALYAGLRLFGISGAIFFPVIFIFIIGLFRSGILNNWIYDYKMFFKTISEKLDIGKKNINI